MASSNSTKPETKTHDYKFSVKLYPDSTDYNCKQVLEDLQKYFRSWVYILHDRDRLAFSRKGLRLVHKRKRNLGALQKQYRRFRPYLAKPHYHFYGKNNPHCKISKKSLVAYLHLPYSYNFRPHDLEFAHDWEACVVYSVHRNAPNKFQYDIEDAVTNMRDFADIIEGRNSLNQDLRVLYEILDDAKSRNEIVPYYELVRKMTLRGCRLQYVQSRMVERISQSYQYYELGQVVQ